MTNMFNRPYRYFVLFVLQVCVAAQLFAADPAIDSLRHQQGRSPIVIPVKDAGLRDFESIEPFLSSFDDEDPLVIPDLLLPDTLEQERQHAHGLRETVEKSQRFRETLDNSVITDLPIGVVKSGGESLNYSIVIDRVKFTTTGSELTAYMSFVIPDNGNQIAFGGKIPLSKDGGIIGNPKIYLLGDHVIKIGSTLVTLKGSYDSKTYVEIDCNGYKGMSLEAVVEFSTDQLVPEDEKGKVIVDQRVKVNFQTYLQDWSELLVKINIPPFQVKGLEGVGFKIDDAYLDWSDLTNPTGLAFPEGYTSSYLTSGSPNLWKGFYLRKAEVRLPPKFQDKTTKQRTRIGVENLVIDDSGFSGKAFAENLINEGDMSGWSYSLDKVQVGFISNQLAGFSLEGKITVPALEKDGKVARMGYKASRGADGNYIFAVTIQDKLKLPLWAADLTIAKGSGITVKEKDDKFYPSATLNGMLSISALSKGPKAELTGVKFEQLIISSEAPYFRPGIFGFGSGDSGSKASSFPLSIRNIGIKSKQSENKVGLSLDVTINIGGDPSQEGFGGTAGLIIWGQTGQQQWGFDNVEITAIEVSVTKPNVYELKGSIRFFEQDATYGDGFRGELSGKLQKISVTAVGVFGKTPTYRFWFADALVEFKSGIVLAPGLAAYSFGGGFFSRMKQATGGGGSAIGQTASGITYVPDENSMGLRAFMSFGGTPSQEAYNGDVTLEISMNRSGGINTISLVGNAYFLTPSLELGSALIKEGAGKVASGAKHVLNMASPRSQLYGTVSLMFDNVNDVFHGTIDVYVNVMAGIVKGIGPNNKAGWAVIHFARDEWYILVGTPDQPIGLEVARLFKAKSYFMMGKNLPGSPPPPQKVSDILGGVNLDYMRDMNALQSGFGFAFGMSFGVDTGDLRFLMFYGRFAAGTGFDIMLKNYGQAYHCEGSSVPLGINGWYANGQAYAFVEGKIGIRVNLRFYKGDYDILAIGAAAILQAKGPNPFWMKGTVGGYYRILGGLVKGTCRFDVTVGKECKPVGESSPLQDVRMIAEVSPAKGSSEVDVFNAPQAAFNVPVGEIFDITDAENKTRYFRARLEEFSITSGSTPIPGTLKWNATKDVAVMDAFDILPSKKEIKVRVKLVFEERLGANWQAVLFQSKPVEEVEETSFTTGLAPDFIPPNNVEFSYPLAGQYNLYPREYAQGFIQLRKGQPELFVPDEKWIKKARMTNAQATQQYKEFDFAYDASARRVNFTIPSDVPLATIQSFDLLNIPRQNKVIDANVQTVSTELIAGNADAAQLTIKNIEGQAEILEIKSLYQAEFRTSRYGTFNEKMSAVSLQGSTRVDLNASQSQVAARLRGDELFDGAELNGVNGLPPLIITEANLAGNAWYEQRVYPLVYEGYPLNGNFTIKWRIPDALGVPPIRDVFYVTPMAGLSISNGEPSIDAVTAFSNNEIRYNLELSMRGDYRDIQNQAADYIAGHAYLMTPRLERLIVTPFPRLRFGSYKVKLSYRIPGINQVSSSYELDMLNNIPDN